MKEWVRPAQFLLTIGIYVVFSLIIPVAVGYWLDQPGMYNRRPLFTFIGLGVGTVIAFAGLARMLLRYKADDEKMIKENKQGKQRQS